MHHICKNIVLVTLFVFMSGCTVDILPEQQEEQTPVTISVSQGSVTRANDTFVDGSFTAGKRVGVFAYAYNETTWQKTLLPNFFNNQPMTIASSGSTSGLSYSPVAYWPAEGRKVAAYGYYPYSGDAAYIQPTVPQGMGRFTYTTPALASEQTDFMVSPLQTDKTSDAGTLNLTFYHVLACIEISVDLTGSEFASVSSVKVLNVRTKGTFSPAKMTEDLNASSDDWRTQAWTTKDDLADVAIDNLPASGNLTVSDATRLLLIPQQCYPSLHRIALTLKRSDDSEVTLTYGLTQLWEAGKTYIYKFSNTNLTNPAFHGNAGKAEDGGTI